MSDRANVRRHEPSTSGIVAALAETDLRVSQRLRDATERCAGARFVAASIAHSADWWWWLLGAVIVWRATDPATHAAITVVVTTIVVTALVVQGLKWIIRRERPFGKRDFLSHHTDPHSFPSGHAARASALVVVGVALGPLWVALLLAPWAALVATVRVALGIHYVSDAIAGILVGVACGLAVLARASGAAH